MQLDFLTHELLPRLEEAHHGERRVFFVDAAHFVLGAFLGMIWCFTRLFIRSASGRKRYSVLGAVETHDHDLVTIQTTGSINAETVCELIRKLDQEYPGACPKSGCFRNWVSGEVITRARGGSYSHFGE